MNTQGADLWDHAQLYAHITEIFVRYDPIGIGFKTPSAEYTPKVQSIIGKLEQAASVDDLQAIIHAELTLWFSPSLTGTRGKYREMAREIWVLWRAAQ